MRTIVPAYVEKKDTKMWQRKKMIRCVIYMFAQCMVLWSLVKAWKTARSPPGWPRQSKKLIRCVIGMFAQCMAKA